jgi:hypothetical protein
MTKPTREHWAQWQATCAFQRCEPEARDAMQTFVYRRFRRCALDETNSWRAHAARVTEDQLPTVADACQIFEGDIHQDVIKLVSAKIYLFVRYGHTQNTLEAGITLRVRESVRRWLSNEISWEKIDPPKVDPESGDVIDPIDTIIANTGALDPLLAAEYLAQAQRVAMLVETELKPTEMRALGLEEIGIAASSQEACDFIGLQKSQALVHAARPGEVVRRAIAADPEFATNSEDQCRHLALFVLGVLKRRAYQTWASEIDLLAQKKAARFQERKDIFPEIEGSDAFKHP